MLKTLTPPAHRHEAAAPNAWDAGACHALIADLTALRRAMRAHATRLAPCIDRARAEHRDSALNLAHFLALRRTDLRTLQDRLAAIGLSSLGRSESHVLANVDKVLGLLHLLVGQPWQAQQRDEPIGFHSGPRQLRRNAERLFGSAPARRDTRIMVTLPSEAATDPTLADRLVAAGMDVARINCAHDDAAAWQAMAAQVRRAAAAAGRPVRVHADLAGPKLRTGALPPGPAVLRVKPQRDAFGRTVAPVRFALRPAGTSVAPADGTPVLDVDPAWFERLRKGDTLQLTDARKSVRRFTLRHPKGGLALAEGPRKAYLVPQTLLHLVGRDEGCVDTRIGGISPSPGSIRLQRGDVLHLLPPDGDATVAAGAPRIACTLAEALAALRVGEPVWFDDGRIGGVARRRLAHGAVAIEITTARDGGETLRADKGINLPDTALDLPALTAQDHADLAAVAPWVDSVGLSFAQSAGDVRALRNALARCGVPERGIVLKVETVRGFAHLPELLFAALEGPAAGVMIARGDLAVECGYERLAEVQEEMLWACEAAHLPVVWATQVLETLAHTGLPSRAEVSDAAMGERAECVMLNKGPHIVDAMHTLDSILRRMQDHQSKKRPLLRALKAWELAPDLAPERGKARRAA
jgi:pyruvate kinase